MLCVRTKVAPSQIEGLGLFAAEFIPRGTIVWKFISGFDMSISKEQLDLLPQPAKDHMAVYAYLSQKSGKYILGSDGGKYFNHSSMPNTKSDYPDDEEEVVTVASADIQPGEEITCDYNSFEKNWNGMP